MSSQSEVLITEDRGRSKSRGPKGKDKGLSKSRPNYKKVECHYCDKLGHIKKKCFQFKKDIKRAMLRKKKIVTTMIQLSLLTLSSFVMRR